MDVFEYIRGTLTNEFSIGKDKSISFRTLNGTAQFLNDGSTWANIVKAEGNAGELQFKSASGSLEASANLSWDNSAKTLKIKGSGSLGDTNIFEGRNFADSLNYWVKDDGTIYLGSGGVENARIKADVNNNIIFGKEALSNLTNYSQNVAIGNFALKTATEVGGCVAIGHNSLYNNSTPSISGNTYNIGIGWNSGLNLKTGVENVVIGRNSASGNNSTGSLSYNTMIGNSVAYMLTTGDYNTMIGSFANGKTTSGYRNVSLGTGALRRLLVGNDNVSLGYESLGWTTGDPTGSFSGNIAIGSYTLRSATNSCNYNLAIGYYAGRYLTTGSYNIFLGYQAGYNETGSNKLYVANSSTANPLIYGEFDNGFARINGELRIATAGTDNMKIRTDGTVQPASVADASAANDSIYYSTDQSKLVYKDSGGTVNVLY